MKNSIYYHAGCPVCKNAEQELLNLISSEVEIVHLGEQKSRIEEAEDAGVKSVPALLTPNGIVLHINYGASIEEVRS